MEKLSLLESVLGKGSKTNRDYYQFMCPFHVGKHGPKLGVSLGSGGWKCWVCPSKGHTVASLFKKINTKPEKVQLARELWNEKVYYKREPLVERLELPKEFVPLWQPSGSLFFDKARNYVTSRGLTENDIVKHKIGFCESGLYRDMIIFPSYSENGNLVFFSGRTFNQLSQFRFKIPENIDKDAILFDENLVNWSEPVIFVESKLDAIAVRRNAVPLFGKKVNSKIKEKIIQEQTPEVIFCLDGDAINEINSEADFFIRNGINAKKVILPINEDPSSLGFEKVWSHINNAVQITEEDNFTSRILNKLRK